MTDKEFCMSSFLSFRNIVDDNKDFYSTVKHHIHHPISEELKIPVKDEFEADKAIEKQFNENRHKKLGILLSGGMDSACLASYMKKCDAYTFRFCGGTLQKEELRRAEEFAKYNEMNLHYVDIGWETVEKNIEVIMKHKGAPVHSIEPQIYQAAIQAQKDGIELMIIGDAADYVFGGMDKLLSKEWQYDEFKKRYVYVEPSEVLRNPQDMDAVFAKYRVGANGIDYQAFLHAYADTESYDSYSNPFETAKMPYLDPYEVLKTAGPLDLQRIRNGDSKYIIRALFRMKYPEISVPEKNPMPRPVDVYFKDWRGPQRVEFKRNIEIGKYSGNQKWLIWCLERFLDMNET